MSTSLSRPALALALLAAHVLDAPPDPYRAQPQERQGQQGDERELPVERQHDGDHADKDQQVRCQRQRRGDRCLLQHADIADQPHRQIAGARPGVEAEGEPLQMAEEVVSDRGQDPVADEGEPDPCGIFEDRLEADDGDQPDGCEREKRHRLQRVDHRLAGTGPVFGGHDPVDDELERPWLEQLESRRGQQCQDGAREQSAMRPQIGREAAQDPTQARPGMGQRGLPRSAHEAMAGCGSGWRPANSRIRAASCPQV
jgi:hypothetical protein